MDLLSRMHAFNSLSEQERAGLAAQFTLHSYVDGDAISRQGTRADAIYILIEGTVELKREEEDESITHLGTLLPGDVFGQMEILRPQPCASSAIAVGQVAALRWNRAAAAIFLEANPSVRASLQLTTSSRELAYELQPSWLDQNETIHGLSRRHPVMLVRKLIPALLLFLAACLLTAAWAQPTGIHTPLWLPVISLLSAIMLAAWQVVDWRNDYCFITNRRAIWTEKIIGLYDSQQEAPLSMVLSISISTSFLGRIFDFGDIVIRTYTGKLRFLNLPRPHLLAAILEEQWERTSYAEEKADRELLHQTLEQRLQPNHAAIEEANPAGDDGTESQAAAGVYQRWTLKVRFEEDGIITYRKHWAILLRDLLLPTTLILVAVLVWIGHLLGWMNILTTTGASLLAAGVMIPLIVFWIYQFLDWSNDIYQITPAQIIDVYRRPLSRELRKVAPIANILGTEVDRRGVFGVMLNFGDVVANVGTEEFTFEGVFDPGAVQQDIVHAQEALLQRQHDQVRNQRREEMVELIDIYHENFAPSSDGGKKESQNGNSQSRNTAE